MYVIIYVIYFCVLNILQHSVNALWDDNTTCPLVCTCRLEHITETSIYQIMQKNNNFQPLSQTDLIGNNEVLPEDDLNYDFTGETVLRSITCILQTETDPLELLKTLPKDTESLTLIQGSDSGNKSINFSDFQEFNQLKLLVLKGAQVLNKNNRSFLLCKIDLPVPQMKYLHIDRVLLKNSKKQSERVQSKANEEVTFEYVKKLDTNSHPLTMIQKGIQEEILPYSKFIAEKKSNEEPLFVGFTNLIVLKITNCKMSNVHWEMFDGLRNLEYLILDKNNIMFIPDFAFYGTPNLKTLSLASNNLLNIQITDLAGLLELEYLDLSHNNFSQLSELSLPPFPKLKLANFRNNPIGVVFPNTFEVMNTTDSLIVGGKETPLLLLPNSFLGLHMLRTLILENVKLPLLKKEIMEGMPNLGELIISGNISEIEFDAFLAVYKIEKLILNNCNIKNISMDAFIGLQSLRILDLSNNNLEYLPPGVFDTQINLKELYLNDNKLTQLPKYIFAKTYAKLIRLNENPWHCSCAMSNWKPMIVNKIKLKSAKICNVMHDKGLGCISQGSYMYKYVYETRMAPKCSTPKKYTNWSVFHVMRKQLKCSEYKPKFKKIKTNPTQNIDNKLINNMNAVYQNISKNSVTQPHIGITEYERQLGIMKQKNTDAQLPPISTQEEQNSAPTKISLSLFNKPTDYENDDFNNLQAMGNNMHNMETPLENYKKINSGYDKYRKIKKYKKNTFQHSSQVHI